MPYPICTFTKPDGTTCSSPALRGKAVCYYHLRDSKRQERISTALRRADVLGPILPPMKSHHDIRSALTEVLNALGQNRLSAKRAGRILFNLQMASKTLVDRERSKQVPSRYL